MPAASRPGTRIRCSRPDWNFPLVATASNSSSDDASGPPNTVLMAAKPPARATIEAMTWFFVARRPATVPRARPSATSGASGPSTMPSTSEMKAARIVLAASLGPAGAKLSPSAGEWPPLPGSFSTGQVSRPASVGSRSTYHHGGSPTSRTSLGMSVQNTVVSPWTTESKSTAAAATGIPASAAAASASM